MIGIDTGALATKMKQRAQTLSGVQPETTPPPASMYAGQGAAMAAGNVQQEKDRAIQTQNGQSQATAMAAPRPVGPVPTAENSAMTYVNNKAAGLNAGRDPGYASEAGRLYGTAVTNGLKTPDASSVNAQRAEDTAASRRQYLARVQSGEAIGQSGFAPGSAQAQRMADQSQAGVNAANQAGQSSANAYIRQRTEDNMNRAQGLETQQYNRNRDILGDAEKQGQTIYNRGQDTITNQHWDTTHADQQKQQAFENSVVAKSGSDTEKRNLLSSLPEGPAKNAAMLALNSGKSVGEALAMVMNPDGTIKDGTGGGTNYRGMDPATAEVQGSQKKAEAWVSATTDLKPGSPEYIAKVRQRLIDTDATVNKPITDATTAATNKIIADKISKGEPLTQTEVDTAKTDKIIPSLTSTGGGARSITSVDGATKYLQDHPDGNVILDGKNVKLIAGGRYSSDFNDSGGMLHKSFAQVQVDGKDYWINEDGLWYDKNPVSMEFNGRLTGDHGSIPNPIKK